jgi:hypothetical protein
MPFRLSDTCSFIRKCPPKGVLEVTKINFIAINNENILNHQQESGLISLEILILWSIMQ